MSGPIMVSRDESVLLHRDWWGKCRTCRFWHGADDESFAPEILLVRWRDSECENPASTEFGQKMDHDGQCGKWDSFDVDVALEVMYDPNDPQGVLALRAGTR